MKSSGLSGIKSGVDLTARDSFSILKTAGTDNNLVHALITCASFSGLVFQIATALSNISSVMAFAELSFSVSACDRRFTSISASCSVVSSCESHECQRRLTFEEGKLDR